MGLDNGIILIVKDEKIPKWLMNLSDGRENTYELCHWRRCRNIRYDVKTRVLGLSFKDNEKNYLIAQDLNHIIEVLKSYNAKNWEHEWMTWKNMKPIVRQQVKILRKVRRWLVTHQMYTLYFYDSF